MIFSLKDNNLPLLVPLGLIAGLKGVNKFGRNTEIDQDVTADVWDGGKTVGALPAGSSLIWLAPTTARIHTIASDNANDNTGGTGANTVIIFYLPDWDTPEATETVTGNLNSGIAMNNAAVMINRMEVVPQSTSTTANAGTITATAATDSTVSARIEIGKGQTQMAIYGIPSTQDLYLPCFYGSVNNSGGATGSINVTLLVNPNPNIQTVVFIVKHTYGLKTTGSSKEPRIYQIYKKILGPAIVKVQVTSTTNNLDVSGGFDTYVKTK